MYQDYLDIKLYQDYLASFITALVQRIKLVIKFDYQQVVDLHANLNNHSNYSIFLFWRFSSPTKSVVNNNVVVSNFYKQGTFVLNSLLLNSMRVHSNPPPPSVETYNQGISYK